MLITESEHQAAEKSKEKRLMQQKYIAKLRAQKLRSKSNILLKSGNAPPPPPPAATAAPEKEEDATALKVVATASASSDLTEAKKLAAAAAPKTAKNDARTSTSPSGSKAPSSSKSFSQYTSLAFIKAQQRLQQKQQE